MPLRIGFDMDGVLADFASAFRAIEVQLCGAGPSTEPEEPSAEEERQSGMPAGHDDRRRSDAIWQRIRSTPDFWRTLKATDPIAVHRIHELSVRYRWEVFFITQRPATDGETVQRQTQHWLVEQGFDLPSVLVIGGSRGAAAGALRLDYHVDDSAQNCLDVLSDSKASPILIARSGAATAKTARRLGIAVAQSVGECLGILEEASAARAHPAMLQRLAAMVGWK
jgi:hypothetical protein